MGGSERVADRLGDGDWFDGFEIRTRGGKPLISGHFFK